MADLLLCNCKSCMRHGPRGEHAEMPKVRRVCAVAAFEYPNTVHPKMSAESTEFDIGWRVRLDHLPSHLNLNGHQGFIASSDTVTGEIGVEHWCSTVFVKPCNVSLLWRSWEHFKHEKAKEFEDLQQ